MAAIGGSPPGGPSAFIFARSTSTPPPRTANEAMRSAPHAPRALSNTR